MICLLGSLFFEMKKRTGKNKKYGKERIKMKKGRMNEKRMKMKMKKKNENENEKEK